MKAKINEILDEFREYVATHNYRETPILTAYVNVDPANPANQKQRPMWLVELKNEAKRLERCLDPEELKRKEAQKKWSRAEEMVMEHLQERKPTGQSVVLFTDLEDFVAVDIPVTVPTRLYYGLPQIKHLLFSLDEYKKYLVMLLSEAEVRLVEVFLTRSTDELRVESEPRLSLRFGRKARTQASARRDLDSERRFVREVVTETNQYFLDDQDFERLVLGGNLKLAHAVRNALHPAVKDIVVGIEPMDMKLPDREVSRRVGEIASNYEREHDLTVVEDIVTLANRRGAAVVEQQGVEAALRVGNVKTLVIPYPIDAERFDELIVDATIHGADIEFVFGDAANRLNEFGGIGASLYYSGT